MSISTPPGQDASPSQVIPLQFVRFPQQFAGFYNIWRLIKYMYVKECQKYKQREVKYMYESIYFFIIEQLFIIII